jgi:uracil-DNA glycosylase
VDPYRQLIERLAGAPARPSVFNPYSGPDGQIRQGNLYCYLLRMAEWRPRILLVGEAPGYRGARVTGVPFTSQAILLTDPSPFNLFGLSAGFRPCGESEVPEREATATILWGTLVRMNHLPLLWNAFPFHPHQADYPRSNRPPTRHEVAAGREILFELVQFYPVIQVIAVGNKAAGALADWGIPADKVRHPAHGGKQAFRRDLAAILSR